MCCIAKSIDLFCFSLSAVYFLDATNCNVYRVFLFCFFCLLLKFTVLKSVRFPVGERGHENRRGLLLISSALSPLSVFILYNPTSRRTGVGLHFSRRSTAFNRRCSLFVWTRIPFGGRRRSAPVLGVAGRRRPRAACPGPRRRRRPLFSFSVSPTRAFF